MRSTPWLIVGQGVILLILGAWVVLLGVQAAAQASAAHHPTAATLSTAAALVGAALLVAGILVVVILGRRVHSGAPAAIGLALAFEITWMAISGLSMVSHPSWQAGMGIAVSLVVVLGLVRR